MEFEALLKRIGPQLKAIAHKLNGRYTVLNDDDLYQEEIIYLWEKWQDGKLQNKTDSYILQGCYFCLKNYLRKVCRVTDVRSVSLQERVTEDAMELEETLSSKQAERDFETIDEHLLKEEITGRLSNQEKKIVEFLLSGFTTREIGEKLGISHVMVVKLKNRIKNKCRGFKEELILG
jgi:RNA polymerase sigma factor (sigma-70 family)